MTSTVLGLLNVCTYKYTHMLTHTYAVMYVCMYDMYHNNNNSDVNNQRCSWVTFCIEEAKGAKMFVFNTLEGDKASQYCHQTRKRNDNYYSKESYK